MIHHRFELLAAVGLMTLLVLAGGVESQGIPEPLEGATILRDHPGHCFDCITLEPEFLLDAPEELGGVGPAPVFRDSAGRLFHVKRFARSALLVFDAQGRYERLVGRAGSGPGEYTDIRSVFIGRNDTLRVYDAGNGRMTTLSPELDFVRSDNLGFWVEDAVEIVPGFMVVNANLRTADRFGYPLHAVHDGTLGLPMGGTAALVNGRVDGNELDRKLARASDSTFWAVHETDYRFELWRTDGTLLRVLKADPEWFDVADRSTVEGGLNPRVRDMEMDGAGRLWVLTNVRSANWEEVAYDAGGGPPGVPNIQSRTGEDSDLRNTMIQVIDPQSGLVLATARIAEYVWSFVGSGRIKTYEEPVPGRASPRAVVWRLLLPQGLPPA